MPATIQDPRVRLRDLLRANWNPANTSGITPRVHTGWYNAGSKLPQVTIIEPDESASGESGYAGIGADGPVQERVGSVPVDCWVHRGMEDNGGATLAINPKELVYQMAREVERIVIANATAVAELQYLSIRTSIGVPPEVERDPTLYHWSVEVGYGWIRTPN